MLGEHGRIAITDAERPVEPPAVAEAVLERAEERVVVEPRALAVAPLDERAAARRRAARRRLEITRAKSFEGGAQRAVLERADERVIDAFGGTRDA
jgi:hypothetical protein